MANKPPIRSAPRLRAASSEDIDSRVPPHDIEAEAAVLSAVMIDPAAIDNEKVRALLPVHFFSESHRRVFDAALYLKVEEKPIDIVTVATWLKDHERLAHVGGMAYLTDILNKAPKVANVGAYAEIVARHARERDVLLATQKAQAALYASKGQPTAHILAELRAEIDRAEHGLQGGAAIQFLDDDALFSPEPPADLVVPTLGLGKGPVHGFFGQGFAGKSVVAFGMGMAVASGRPIWGAFRCKQGIWVHLDHEQGKRRTKGLIQRMTLGMGIDREEIRGQIRAAIYPSINLTSPSALDHYCRALEGATIATCDALKGMTPGVDENDSQIREFIDLLGVVSERTGCMIVLIHHAGKTPMDGSRPRKESGRGSSGIFDACQSVWILSAKKGEPTVVTHEKDRELGYLVDDFGLRIEDVPLDEERPRGGLRVVHLDREQLRAPQKSAEELADAEQKAWLATIGRVRDAIKKNAGKGTDAIREIVKMKKETVVTAVKQLIEDGDVVERTRSSTRGGQVRQLYLASAAPPPDKPN